MIGEVAAFTIDDLVKELRCMAARDMGSDEWKKCVELHEKFFDDVCERCEYHHDGSPCGYDPGNPYDLCSLAADEIEMLRGRAERPRVRYSDFAPGAYISARMRRRD